MTKGDKIKTLREEQGISQTELAERARISKQLLYKYENDIITNIPSDKIESISRVLGSTPAFIMGWDDPTPAIEDEEIQEYLEELRYRPEMRMLFKTLKSTSKEDIEKTVKIIEALRGQSE